MQTCEPTLHQGWNDVWNGNEVIWMLSANV
jgi:hypothetical protein